jgi:N-acetylglutamate synthase-like GNAT family acetyltransferase
MDAQSIRSATSSDAEATSSLLARVFEKFRLLYTERAFVATAQPKDGIIHRMKEGPVWVAEAKTEIIGTVSAVCLDGAVMVRGMAVALEARGKGIGRALLTLTEDYAMNQDVDRLFLYTTAFLLDAIALYRSFGFTFTGEKACPKRNGVASNGEDAGQKGTKR